MLFLTGGTASLCKWLDQQRVFQYYNLWCNRQNVPSTLQVHVLTMRFALVLFLFGPWFGSIPCLTSSNALVFLQIDFEFSVILLHVTCLTTTRLGLLLLLSKNEKMSPWFYNHSIPSKILSCLAPKISKSSQDLTVLALMWKKPTAPGVPKQAQIWRIWWNWRNWQIPQL